VGVLVRRPRAELSERPLGILRDERSKAQELSSPNSLVACRTNARDENDGSTRSMSAAIRRTSAGEKKVLSGSPIAHPRRVVSRIDLSRSRSLRFARRIALANKGAASFPKPDGSPRFRRVILVSLWLTDSYVYVVSMGNGPSPVRITRRSPGASSTNSYVYARRRPRNCATNARRDPTRSGGVVFHSTDLMLTYHEDQ